MARATKKRRKPDGSTEIVGDCPVCGSRDNYEINVSTRKHHCWACGYGGVYTGPALLPLFDGPAVPHVASKPSGPITTDIPATALYSILRRGFDPEYVVTTYDVQWDGARLCWPTGTGFARRAIYPWEEPKVLTVGQKGLIGVNRLRTRQHVVLVEGDFKAAAIPAPWIGVGLQGTEITEFQAALLATHEPASVTVMLDHGYDVPSAKVRGVLNVKLPVTTRVTNVPCPAPGPGPDDVPRAALVSALLAALKEMY